MNTSNPDNLPIADLTNKAKRWGWAYLSPSTGATATYNIYAGAGLNYISKGYLIGNVTYTWDPILQEATASVSISNNFYVNSYHIHIGDSLPGNVAAPGQYSGCIDSFDYPQSLYSFTCVVDNIADFNADGIWFITHIGVCKTF